MLASEMTKLQRQPTLSVVLSFFNEAEVLPELIARLRAVLGRLVEDSQLSSYELVFVNDASTDGSEDVIVAATEGHDDIRLITMSRNFGVSPCVLAGMQHTVGDLVIYMDADLQDPPELIPELLQAWREGGDVDVVNTVRIERAGESREKLLLTRLAYRLLRRTTNINFLVEAGDFKLLSRRVVEHLIEMKEKLPFVRGMIYWIGFKQTLVKYRRQARPSGTTKFPMSSPKVFYNFFFSALISFSSAPLLLSILLGAVTSVFAFLFLIYVVVQKFVVADVTQGWTMIMATLLLLGGMQLLTTGINGLYINSIFLESKTRPNYIIHRTYGFPPSHGTGLAPAKSVEFLPGAGGNPRGTVGEPRKSGTRPV